MPTQRNDLLIFTTSNPSVVNMDEPLSFIEGTEQGENDSRDECERFRSGFWKIGYGGSHGEGEGLRPSTISRSCGQRTPETVADTFVVPRTRI
jgi:hypothetical protein